MSSVGKTSSGEKNREQMIAAAAEIRTSLREFGMNFAREQIYQNRLGETFPVSAISLEMDEKKAEMESAQTCYCIAFVIVGVAACVLWGV